MISIESVPRPTKRKPRDYPLDQLRPGTDDSFAVPEREFARVYLFAKRNGMKVQSHAEKDGLVRFWRIT